MKRDKNASVQISLYNIFEQISRVQHLSQYRDDPRQLAQQIDDLKVLLEFASSNYTQKARSILNLSKQFTKSIDLTVQQVNQLDYPLMILPQPSFPQLAYETLKKSTGLQLKQEIFEAHQQLDWKTVQSEYQLKYLESYNISNHLKWENCFNSQQRCLQIGSKIENITANNYHRLGHQNAHNNVMIQLNLKIQGEHITWNIKKVLFHNNPNLQLLNYYNKELLPWIRQQHRKDIQESQKHVLSILSKSIDYVDIIMLFIQLKNMPFNRDIGEIDSKNAILNLFDKKQTFKYKYLKNKNVKVCFLLAYSNFPPSLFVRVGELNVLKIQFGQKNDIHLNLRLKNGPEEVNLKKLFGQIRKTRLSMSKFIQIVHEVLQSLQTYQKFVSQRVQQYKLDIFQTNRSTHFLVYLRSLDVMLIQQQASESNKILTESRQCLSCNHISSSGLYLIYQQKNIMIYLPPMIIHVSSQPQLLLKTQNTQQGFINKLFKNHTVMSFQEVMCHLYFLQMIQHSQIQGDWGFKLNYVDIYTKEDVINYKFKQLIIRRPVNHNTILKREIKAQQSHPSNVNKDYIIYIKISRNFKVVHFIYVTSNQNEQRRTNSITSINGKPQSNNRNSYRAIQNQIPQKYFTNTWREYMKRRNQSEVLRNEYLDVAQLLKTTHYVLNHIDFNKYIKGKAGIFKNQEMIKLMDQ